MKTVEEVGVGVVFEGDKGVYGYPDKCVYIKLSNNKPPTLYVINCAYSEITDDGVKLRGLEMMEVYAT